MPDHCIQEPISHFHPAEENQINCLGIKGVKRWSTKQKKDFNKIDEMTLEETGVHSNRFTGATPGVSLNSPGQTSGLYYIIIYTIKTQTFIYLFVCSELIEKTERFPNVIFGI